jgi:prepilin-type N-terminal cleavage/methylation domain-containing protein
MRLILEKTMLGNKKGYTFIELTVVVLLIGLMFALTIPRFRYAILTDNLKSTSRKLVGTIKNLRSQAFREHKNFVLHFDLESNRFWIDSTDMTKEERVFAREKASSLPEDVRVLGVRFGTKGKNMDGEAAIRFDKKGYVQQSVISLGSENGREFSIVLSPFLSRIKILENTL